MHTSLHVLQLPIQHLSGISPLPTFLTSPYLDSMTMASPNLLAMFNQMAQTTRGNGIGSLLGEGLTPGGLLSPNLWPDTTRSGHPGLLKSLAELDPSIIKLESARGQRRPSTTGGLGLGGVDGQGDAGSWQQHHRRRPSEAGLDGRQRRSSVAGLGGGGGDGGGGLMGIMPLVSPSGAPGAGSAPSVYKGVQYDKERNRYQVWRWCGVGVAGMKACCEDDAGEMVSSSRRQVAR